MPDYIKKVQMLVNRLQSCSMYDSDICVLVNDRHYKIKSIYCRQKINKFYGDSTTVIVCNEEMNND
jgi:hypothetical protein